MSLKLTSTAFEDGAVLPPNFLLGGGDCSPPFSWKGLPPGCASLALICDDLHGPKNASVHWVVYGIPATLDGLPMDLSSAESLPSGLHQGTNDFGRVGYTGPNPKGTNSHRYQFTLYALDSNPRLQEGATKRELLRAMNGSVLARAHLSGTCLRNEPAKPKRRSEFRSNSLSAS